MIQNPTYLMKELAGVPYLLPYGQSICDRGKSLQVNATGAFLWKQLEAPVCLEEMIQRAISYYEADTQEDQSLISQDVEYFLYHLEQLGIVLQESTANSGASGISEAVGLPESHAASGALQLPGSLVASEASAGLALENTGCSAEGSQTLPAMRLKIAGLSLALYGPRECFSPKLEPFCEDFSESPALSLAVHMASMASIASKQPPEGRTLLTTSELLLQECQEWFVLSFSEEQQYLRALWIHKSGTLADIYCKPYSTREQSAQLAEELFHGIRFAFLYTAQQKNRYALHSASLLYQDKAWLFSGPSGTGKSTHTELWREEFQAELLNGDLNLISIEDGQPCVHGIPWCGTSNIYTTKSYPLGGIILLKKADHDQVVPLTPNEEILSVSQRLISPTWTKPLFLKNLEFTECLRKHIRIARLLCTKKPSAAHVMKGWLEQIPTEDKA